MKKLLSILAFFVLFGCGSESFVSTAQAGCTDLTADTPSYADVAACVAASTYGDTITVPAGDGTETWASQLAIVKGVTLVGPGSGNLNITNTSGDFIIKYTPDATSLTNNDRFEVSGFTFTGGSGIQLFNRSATVASNIVIHDNTFLAHTGQIIDVTSTFGGVVYSNTGTSSADILVELSDAGRPVWEAHAWSGARSDALYFEDNTWTTTKAAPQPFASSNGAYPYVFRYNDIFHTGDGNIGALFDIHGNQGSGNVYSALGATFYGNDLTKTFVGRTTEHLFHRGGTALYFYNKTNGTGVEYIQDLEQVIDSENPTTPGSYPSGTSQFNGQPQHISESYYWNNRGASAVVTYTYTEICGVDNFSTLPEYACDPPGSTMEEDSEFWTFVPSGFDGTTGVGCGVLGSRPATCTVGVGYWATTQSCSTVADANIGVSPTTPIAGTLYTCTSTDTWTDSYSPYTYPHPLRVGVTSVNTGITLSGATLQ
ncbi:hypothetical protein KAR91_31830 [Candidatus Pacearchaeota archaeon]|nr:hypothetical protein [Candidatus Pacearchaeota archaeon]